jgi:hypothetical protein
VALEIHQHPLRLQIQTLRKAIAEVIRHRRLGIMVLVVAAVLGRRDQMEAPTAVMEELVQLLQ